MIVPIEWLKEYVKTNKSAQDIAASFTSLGLLLDKPIVNNVMDLEHRMDRSDWLSILGCARDFAAYENLRLIKPEGLVPESKGEGNVEIRVEASDLVRRFNTRVFRNVKVKESPDWLKNRLGEYGLPAINNIVDITNYVMVELGQPMHAQDLSKFSKQEIVLRRAQNGEEITTLLGEKVKLDEETLILAEGNNLIGIGAIVGGKATAVDETTTDIILDAGNYNQANIRKTSRRLNIRNETVLRTEKFLHPHLTQVAIERATKLILDLAGGDYYNNTDYYPKETGFKKMPVTLSRLQQIGGIELNREVIENILNSLEYKTLEKNSAGYLLEVPYFRTDIEVEDDVVADILRINGYSNIPMKKIDEAPPKEVTPEIYNFENHLKDILSRVGMHEHITSPLVKADETNKQQIVLVNSLNSEQNALRTSIVETLNPVLDIYKKHRIVQPKLFEIGLTYTKTGKKYEDLKEIRTLAGVVSMEEGVEESNKVTKTILATLFKNLGINNIVYKIEENTVNIYQNNLKLGETGVNWFSIETEQLLMAEKTNLRVRDIIMHQSFEDITLETGLNENLGTRIAKIHSLSEMITDIKVISRYTSGDKTKVTIRIVFENSSEIPQKSIEEVKQKIHHI